MKKKCSKCNIEKGLKMFCKHPTGLYKRQSICRACQKDNVVAWKKEHPDLLLKYKLTNRKRLWAHGSINMHRKLGFKVNLEIDWLTKLAEDAFNCKICGDPIDWYKQLEESKKSQNYSKQPTLDRTDNEYEMNKDNVQIVHRGCNCKKNSRSMKEFIAYSKYVLANYQDEKRKSYCRKVLANLGETNEYKTN